MISCLVLFHPTITSLTKCRLLRSIFYTEKFEIEVLHKHTVIIYIRDIEKIHIWQAALNIEMMDIFVGYGFGRRKNQARNSAFERLNLIKKELCLST